MSVEGIKEQLLQLDPNEMLAVYHYLHRYETDRRVKKFVDLTLHHRVIPVLPTQDMILAWVQHNVILELPENLMTDLHRIFLSYMVTKQLNETAKFELDNAAVNRKHLPVMQSEEYYSLVFFGDLPINPVVEAQKDPIRVMKSVFAESNFVMQYLLLMAIDRVMKYINNTLQLSDQQQIHVTLEHILGNIYVCAQMAFDVRWHTKLLVKL